MVCNKFFNFNLGSVKAALHVADNALKALVYAGDALCGLPFIPCFVKSLAEIAEWGTERFIDSCNTLDSMFHQFLNNPSGQVHVELTAASLENTNVIYNAVKCDSVDQLLKGHGCNGVDDNCDGQIDDCQEVWISYS